MTEDGLGDIESLYFDMKTDGVSAGYLKMAQSFSFSEFCVYTIELPLRELKTRGEGYKEGRD